MEKLVVQQEEQFQLRKIEKAKPKPVAKASSSSTAFPLSTSALRYASNEYHSHKNSRILGPFCAHKGCHGHVPYRIRGHQGSMAANLCKKCYTQEIQTGWVKDFPHLAVAAVDSPCCRACTMMCKCGVEWDVRSDRCHRHDTEEHGCETTPVLPERGDPLLLLNMEYYDRKMVIVKNKMQQVKAEHDAATMAQATALKRSRSDKRRSCSPRQDKHKRRRK
jgi:hypothetical protein